MNKLFVKCFVMVCVILLASCAKNLTPQESIAEAREYIEVKDFATANITLKNAALKYPDNAEIRYELAGVSLAQGDGESAQKEARRAVELGMPPEEVTRLLIGAMFLQGDFDKVLSESESLPAALDDHTRADILAYRAHALMQQQQFRLAEAVITEALKFNENSVLAVHAKASYEAQVGRRETAMTLAKRVVELDPTFSDAWALIGDLHAADGDLPAAKEALSQAVAHRGYVSLSNARLAFVLAQMDEFVAAKSNIEALFGSGYAKQSYVNFVKGYIAFREANYPAAVEALEVSIEGDPNNTASKFYLVASYLRDGRPEQARQVANKLYSDLPNSVEVARMFGSINIREQDFDAAREVLSPLVDGAEQDPVALGMLGSMALMQGDGDQAAGYLERLVALSPDNQSVKQMLNLAMTMRGDFVSEMSVLSEQTIAPEEFGEALLSAAAALKQNQVKQALTIAENLQQQFPDSVEPLNMLAAIYLSVGDWRKGKEFLEQVLAKQPLEPSAAKSLAKIYVRSGEEARALALITSYQQKNPEDQEGSGVLALAVVANKNFQQAEPLLVELLEKNPGNLEVKARLVQLYFDNGKYEEVLHRTEQLDDKIIQEQQVLIELRGKSMIKLGDYKSALANWERWVKVSPNSVLANYYYADSLANSNQPASALKYLEKSRQLNSEYLPARIMTIRVLALSGDMDKALREMEQLQSDMREDRGDVWFTAAWLDIKAEKYAMAEQALNKSLAAQPTPEAALLLFTTLNTLGRVDDALSSLEGWHEKFPQNVPIMALLGQTYMARKDEDSATAIYRRLLDANPESILALNNLAWLTQEANLNEAITFGQRASTIAPDDPIVLDTLGVLLAKNDQHPESERLLRRAVELQPDNYSTRLHLAQTLFGLGNKQEAVSLATGVLQKSGDAELSTRAAELLDSAKSKP